MHSCKRNGHSKSLLRSILQSMACVATTLSVSASLLLAQEPLPITFRQPTNSAIPAATLTPMVRSRTTFPATSSAPIRWKSQPGEVRLIAHLDDVEHATADLQPVAEGQPADIQPAAFTLTLDGPKNGAPTKVEPAGGSSRRTAIRVAQGGSVLNTRRPPARVSHPLKDPFKDREQVQTPPSKSEPVLLTPVEQVEQFVVEEEASNAAQAATPNSNGALQLSDDVSGGPPLPEADPDDAAPAAPETLRQRPTPQIAQQPAPQPPLQLPGARNVAPPAKKKRCSNPNDRDCCADEDVCVDRLKRITSDKLIRFGKEQLDITPRYMPNEKVSEHERNEERKRQQLTLAGKREWQDKNGRVVANGRLLDLALGNAIIESESGEPVELNLRTLSDDDLCFIAAWYSLPTECTLGNEQFEDRQFIASTMTWKASALCHKPLYWEDVQLERYGHTAGPVVQPVLSGAHFFVNVALLPYKMGINPPNECQYPLGYYRPGSCAPWMLQPFPLSARGALTATGFYTGANFLIP